MVVTSVSVKIEVSKSHSQPVPAGMRELVENLLLFARLSGEWEATQGENVQGKSFLRGVRVLRHERNAILLRCQPGGNDTNYFLWLKMQNGLQTADVFLRLQKAAKRFRRKLKSPKSRTRPRRKQEILTFGEVLARAVPMVMEGEAMQQMGIENRATAQTAPAPFSGERKTDAAVEISRSTDLHGFSEDPARQRQAMTALCAAADSTPNGEILAGQCSGIIRQACGLGAYGLRPIGRFVAAWVSDGLLSRVLKKGKNTKAYKVTEKGREMARFAPTSTHTRASARLAALEEKARPIRERRERIAEIDAMVAALAKEKEKLAVEIAAEAEDARKADALLTELDSLAPVP